MTTGQLYTEISGQFQDNKRIYFGPVDIDRLRIQLLDDRGNAEDHSYYLGHYLDCESSTQMGP